MTPAYEKVSSITWAYGLHIPEIVGRCNPGRCVVHNRNPYSTGKPPTQSALWYRRYLFDLVWNAGGGRGQRRSLLGLEQETETSSPTSSAILKAKKMTGELCA